MTPAGHAANGGQMVKSTTNLCKSKDYFTQFLATFKTEDFYAGSNKDDGSDD